MKHNKILFIALLIIIFLDAVGYVVLPEHQAHNEYNKYGLFFLIMAFVCIIGLVAWRKYPVKWPAKLWLLTYISFFCILVGVRIIDRFIVKMPASYIITDHHIREIFSSPLPFLVLYFFVKKTNGIAAPSKITSDV